MVTRQEIEQRAANLSTEQRAAVNKQLSGMSTEELSNRTVQDIPEAPQPVQPVPEPVGDIAQPGDEAYDERKRQHQSDSGNYFISQTPGDESAPRAATAEELKTPIRSTNTGASQQGGRVSGESDSEYSDRIRDEIMNGEGSYLERTQKLEQFRAQQRAERLSRDTEPELFAEPTNVQEVKNEAIVNEADELALQEQKQQQASTQFDQMLQSGASIQELAQFANENSAYADSFRSSIRSNYKNTGNMRFVGKYSGMSPQNMYSAVQSGDLKVGSERYNMLPEAQRAAFEQYRTSRDAPTVVPQSKDDVFDGTSAENVVDFSNIESFISKMFSSDLRTKLDEARNDDRVVDLTTELNAKASELEKFDLDGIRASKKLADDLGNQGFSPAMIASTVRDDEANRSIIRLGKVSEYNRLQGNLQSIKDDIDSDLELFKFEDQQAKEKYGLLFDIYNSRRAEQRADASAIADREFQAEQTREEREYEQKVTAEERLFLAQNQEITTKRQQDFQRELAQFQIDNRQGQLVDDNNGNVNYIVDGQIVNTLKGVGKRIESDVAGDEVIDKYYDEKTKTFTAFIKDGKTSKYRTVGGDVNGNLAGGYIGNTGSGNITSHGGEHDNWAGLDIDGAIGDPIYTPLGGRVLKVEDYGNRLYGKSVLVELSDGNIARFSHLDSFNGLEVGDYSDKSVNFEKGAIIGSIGNTGYVIPGEGGDGSHLDLVILGKNGYQTEEYLRNLPDDVVNQDEGLFNKNFEVEFRARNNKELSNADLNTILEDNFGGSQEEFNRQAELYSKKIETESALPLLDNYLEDLKYLRDRFGEKSIKESLANPFSGSGLDKFTSNQLGLGDSGSILGNVKNKVAFQELLDLKKDGATFGALTEKEFANIGASTEIGKLTTSSSPELWEEALGRLISNVENAQAKIKTNNPFLPGISVDSSDDDIENYLNQNN